MAPIPQFPRTLLEPAATRTSLQTTPEQLWSCSGRGEESSGHKSVDLNPGKMRDRCHYPWPGIRRRKFGPVRPHGR